MIGRKFWQLAVAAFAVALLLTGSEVSLQAAMHADPSIHIGPGDIGGVVTSKNGPEAGVWVIALTNDLPTKFARIVVTDDHGRYLVPDLPKATYTVWSRGYGLVDGPKVTATPGKALNLQAVVAADAAAAAQYYPAIYWYSMLSIPPASDFPGTGAAGNGIGTTIKSQDQWIDLVKTDGCVTCHQLGNRATRTIPAAFGHFANGAAAWGRRIESGQAAGIMTRNVGQMGPMALKEFGGWTDRVAQGELPFAKPSRPAGIERNVVITEWDWGTPTMYLHDEVSTDKRNPTVNAYGKIYGSTEESSDFFPTLDPVHNIASFVKAEVLDPATPDFGGTGLPKPMQPSAYWGDKRIWTSQTIIHNPMFDEQGNVWLTARIRPLPDPAYCSNGAQNPSAQIFPLKQAGREAEMYDPHSGKFLLANLCFPTHHLQFAHDADDTLFFSPGGGNSNVLGWLNARQFEATGDAAKSQGWTPLILDTTGTGKRTPQWTEPGAPPQPGKDMRVTGDFYGLGMGPDGAVWGDVLGVPGKIMRVALGPNPPATALSEQYNLPENDPKAAVHGFSPRGMDIDTNGVVYVPLASGQLGQFDRRKCKGPLNGPTATGNQCPEGWTLYPFPGPQFRGLNEPGSAEAAYYTWVDQFDAVGLGANVPYATGNENEAIVALVHGKWVTMRVPYPMGFFAKNVDARIDDANAGWKGRGLWTTFGSRTPWHMETGKGTRPNVLHIQVRPNPLAD